LPKLLNGSIRFLSEQSVFLKCLPGLLPVSVKLLLRSLCFLPGSSRLLIGAAGFLNRSWNLLNRPAHFLCGQEWLLKEFRRLLTGSAWLLSLQEQQGGVLSHVPARAVFCH
jgi:hypothetical protein